MFQVHHIYLICQRALCFLVSCDLLFVVTCFYYYMHLWNACASISRAHPTPRFFSHFSHSRRLSWGILSESCLCILFPLSKQLVVLNFIPPYAHLLRMCISSLRWLAAKIGGSPQKMQHLKISPNLKRKNTLGINSRHVFCEKKICLLKTWGDKKNTTNYC